MKILWSGIFLTIYLMAQGHCVTLLDGQETTRTEFCVGDDLTLVCSGNAGSFTWIVGTFAPNAADLVVSSPNPNNMANGFSSTFLSNENSTLSFIVQAEHNGTQAICQDFNTAGNKFLTFTILVYGPPSAPMVTAVQNDALNSFSVGITSTDPASICISDYNVTLTDSVMRSSFAMVPANSSNFDAAVLFNTNFELCSLTYQFDVVASTGGGVGTANGEINVEGLPSVNAMIADDNITVDIPDVFLNCIVNLTYYFQGESGVFMANADVLLLSMFNTETCTEGVLRINPMILGVERPSLGANITLCEPPTTIEVTSMAPSRSPVSATTDSAFLSVTAGALMTMLGVTVALMAAML